MNEDIKKSFWFNLLIVLALCTVLYILFFISLGWITRHGSEVKIPNVTKKNIKTAVNQLEDMGFDVLVDSAYEPKQKAFLVLSQVPDVGSTVKKGRTVFLTVNKAEPPMTPMPNLLNLSFRSASMILKNNKLLLGDTTYKPDIAKGAILSQLYKGKDIRPGQMVPQGSRISLVIGDGLSNTQFNVPEVLGYSFEQGIAVITGSGLQYTAIWDGEITDSAAAVIYNQFPKPINELGAPNRIKEGDIIDIRIKQSASLEEIESNKSAASPVNGETTPVQ